MNTNQEELMQALNQKRVYKAKYLSPTNYKGSRVKLTNLYSGESKIYPYNYKYNNIQEIATDIIENKLTYLKVIDYFYDKQNLYLIATNKN